MELGMNDIDDILRSNGINPPTPASQASLSDNTSGSYFSDEDLTDILEDNGFQDERHEEEVENAEALENQDAEQEVDYEPEEEDTLEVARGDFNQAMDEYTESNQPSSPVEEHTSEEAKIPLNSPTLLMDESTTRFSGAEWFSEIQKQRIIIGGCGGISSNLCFQLARMIPANITIYDDDTVETVNMAGQLFSRDDIGKTKVDAMAGMISSYTNMVQFNAINEKFTSTTEPGDVMMCGFDNMKARKTFFGSWFDHIEKKSMGERAKCLLLDGRLSLDTLQILCIRGDDEYNINRYQSEFLFSDSQAEQTVCSMKQTTYLACMIGSLMVNLFTNFVAGQLNPIIPYDLPFFTEYDAQNMIFKTES